MAFSSLLVQDSLGRRRAPVDSTRTGRKELSNAKLCDGGNTPGRVYDRQYCGDIGIRGDGNLACGACATAGGPAPMGRKGSVSLNA